MELSPVLLALVRGGGRGSAGPQDLSPAIAVRSSLITRRHFRPLPATWYDPTGACSGLILAAPIRRGRCEEDSVPLRAPPPYGLARRYDRDTVESGGLSWWTRPRPQPQAPGG